MKYRRLNVNDRLKIQAMLSDDYSLSKIAKKLDVNKSTISREIKNNSEHYPGYNIKCYKLPLTGVCNTCPRKVVCNKDRLIYNYVTAQQKSDFRASVSRQNKKIDNESMKILDDIVKNGTSNGQSLHHIYVSNPELKNICSERTIRRMCYRRELTTKPHELKRYVRYKHEYKKTYKEIQLKNPKILINRTYEDFLYEIGPNKTKDWVEFDSVVGKRTDKLAILTITLVKEAFQFGLVIKKGNSDSVVNQLKKLFKKIGPKYTDKIFNINLADNGTEFSKFNEIEFDELGQKIRKTFFTNPYKSSDKPHCEKNHEIVRYVYRKGRSLNNITQEELNEVFSNINSYVRKSRNDCIPYELIERKYGKEFLDLINIRKKDKRKVKLIPIV